MTQTTALRIIEHRQETADNVVIKFMPAEGQKIDYLPGQFLAFTFNINGREIRRSYSICSSPALDEPLSHRC